MNEPTKSASVDILQHYSKKDATELGLLLPHLSSRFGGSPVAEELISSIIESPFHDLFVARVHDGNIAGVATLSTVLGISSGKGACLEDFVVSPDYRGQGIADLLWASLVEWCEQRNIAKLTFTSKPERSAAHRFYLKHGAQIRETSAFVKIIE